jgi:hypothetical protein
MAGPSSLRPYPKTQVRCFRTNARRSSLSTVNLTSQASTTVRSDEKDFYAERTSVLLAGLAITSLPS